MKAALFLTAAADPARQLLAELRRDHPDAAWQVYLDDELRRALADVLAGWDVRRDKPRGGRVAFVRALRAERLDLAVVAWQGGERFLPMKLVVLLAGARQTVAVDRRGRRRRVCWWQPWTWAVPLTAAALGLDPLVAARAVAAVYRGTLGLLLGTLVLLPWLSQVRRRP